MFTPHRPASACRRIPPRPLHRWAPSAQRPRPPPWCPATSNPAGPSAPPTRRTLATLLANGHGMVSEITTFWRCKCVLSCFTLKGYTLKGYRFSNQNEKWGCCMGSPWKLLDVTIKKKILSNKHEDWTNKNWDLTVNCYGSCHPPCNSMMTSHDKHVSS